MIDYFALLDQPRAPWLDLDELKNRFHEKTLRFHPDAEKSRSRENARDVTFANLNEAYQVLQDPKRRLLHLLTLEGAAPSSANETIPEPLQKLFPEVGALTKRANSLLEKLRATSNRLSRSLLQPELLELQKEAKEVREKIRNVFDAALAELQQINAAWVIKSKEKLKPLSDLYIAFAYLTRWSAQLDEILFQLSL